MTAPAVTYLRADGPGGGWARAAGPALHAGTAVVLYASAGSWSVPDGPGLRVLLGREYERYRAAGHRPAARARFAASRRLVKHAAAAVLDVPADELELARGPAGRPYLRGCDRLGLSLSHTGDLLVLALSLHGPIGADAERLGRSGCRVLLAQRACTAQELSDLRALPAPERGDAVLRLWTLKEAYTKALGVGTGLPFRTFGFRVEGTTAVLHDNTGEPVRTGEWTFATHRLGTGHVVSTAHALPPGA
ncbi:MULTISPECIES: 4'-phosphopantetheinyl transferase family protein [Streptomyces]|uniref:4'-phosphopantetheinyl transferase family protein n=1 Tax=Streptomyces eurythermus TaxID=42237 RepID=A0ABW6Z6H3_9ACTN|nr:MULTISPECIES: 4'-phosphopantetheinyl transferase superfamily protein [Streptomyces]QIS74318.1 4'-phosphopantetheinyl transferase superfamily protein [Streptomyces sp. DSM 40868]